MKLDKELLKKAKYYFEDKMNQFGTTVKGLDWNSTEAQKVRFEQFAKLINDGQDRFSVCDYGCGYGDFYEFLKDRGYHCNYTGVDIVEKAITYAEQKFDMDPEAEFIHGSKLNQAYDYIVASGIFNIQDNASDEAWEKYILEVLEGFHVHSKKGFAFNCLTKYSDVEYMKDYLYYADPLFLFDYAKTHFSRNVALLHDYGLYDFTILVKKDV